LELAAKACSNSGGAFDLARLVVPLELDDDLVADLDPGPRPYFLVEADQVNPRVHGNGRPKRGPVHRAAHGRPRSAVALPGVEGKNDRGPLTLLASEHRAEPIHPTQMLGAPLGSET
jgi:hypothetical protein